VATFFDRHVRDGIWHEPTLKQATSFLEPVF
jgi:hypothetical protein